MAVSQSCVQAREAGKRLAGFLRCVSENRPGEQTGIGSASLQCLSHLLRTLLASVFHTREIWPIGGCELVGL